MKRYSYLLPIAVVALLVAIVLVRGAGRETPEYTDSRVMMDTFVEIRLWGEGAVPGEAALDSAFAVIAGVNGLLGDGVITRAESSLFAYPEVDSIMALGRLAWRLTGGAFDPTIGAVSTLWEFYPGSEPPHPDSVAAALAWVGLGKHGACGADAREAPGLVLDLGGVAKGYAIDMAADKLERLGFQAALINAGGDIRIMGNKPGGGPWRIAIRHPRDRGEFLGCLSVGPAAIATSGDYERCFTHEGVSYHHILDPCDGMPARGALSVTVIGSDAGLCDALATGLFVAGGAAAAAIAESLPGVEAVIVADESCRPLVTSGARKVFEEAKR